MRRSTAAVPNTVQQHRCSNGSINVTETYNEPLLVGRAVRYFPMLLTAARRSGFEARSMAVSQYTSANERTIGLAAKHQHGDK